MAEHRPDQALERPFDPQIQDMPAGSALWIVGRNKENKVTHTQAMRMIDLQGQGLDRYMRDNFQQFPPTGVDLNLTRLQFRAGPVARGIAGRVCYHGEVWVWLYLDQHYGSGISSILGWVTFLTAM